MGRDGGVLHLCLIGSLLAARLTALGLLLPRLFATGSSTSSRNSVRCSSFLSSGGEGAERRQRSSHDPHRMGEGEFIGIALMFQRRLVHQPPDGKVSQQQSVDLLYYQIRALAA